MARVVQPHVPDSGLGEQRFPFVPVVVRVDWLAVRLAPDEIPFTPGFARRLPLGFLRGLVRAQRHYELDTRWGAMSSM